MLKLFRAAVLVQSDNGWVFMKASSFVSRLSFCDVLKEESTFGVRLHALHMGEAIMLSPRLLNLSSCFAGINPGQERYLSDKLYSNKDDRL